MLVKHVVIAFPTFKRWCWVYAATLAWSIPAELLSLPGLLRSAVGFSLMFCGFIYWTEENVPSIRERFNAWRDEGRRLKEEWERLK